MSAELLLSGFSVADSMSYYNQAKFSWKNNSVLTLTIKIVSRFWIKNIYICELNLQMTQNWIWSLENNIFYLECILSGHKFDKIELVNYNRNNPTLKAEFQGKRNLREVICLSTTRIKNSGLDAEAAKSNNNNTILGFILIKE